MRWTDNVQAIATSNGVKLDSVLVKSTGLYPNNVELVLASPLRAGDVVRYALFIGDGTDFNSFSQVIVDEFVEGGLGSLDDSTQNFVQDGTNYTMTLSQAPFSYGPAGIHTLVQIGDKILTFWI